MRPLAPASVEATHPAATSAARGRTGVSPWWLGLGLFVVLLILYGPALKGGFIWDDDAHVTKPELRSLGGLFRIWFEIGATQQYYPVLHSAFWLEQFFFGDTPTGYHVLNVLLHAAGACLFARLLQGLRVPGAWLAAALFALHPVGVESVAWISEQKNTLSLVWYLLAALAYLRFDASRQRSHYAVATGFFLLALGTKTVTASLPAALLVVFWWQRGRFDFRRDVAPLLPWFGLALAAGAMTAWVEHRFVGGETSGYELGPWARVLLASRIVFFYLGKLVFPAELIFVYPRWKIDAGEIWPYLPLGGLLLLAGVAWRGRAHRGPIAAGLLFVGTLFPALGFVNVYPFMFSFVADHFQYLASLGIFALAGAALAQTRTRWPGGGGAVAATALVIFAALTWRQSGEYRDGITLYRATIAKNPTSWMPHNNLGIELLRLRRGEEAIPHLEAATRLRPGLADPENNLGFALIGLGQPERAIPHLERALEYQPDFVFAYNNLGIAYMKLGRLAEAEARLREGLRLRPAYPEAQLNLALVLGRQNRTAEAWQHFEAAARQSPGHVEVEFNWAIALANTRRFAEAALHFDRALKLAPTRADIHFAFGRALGLEGRFDEALARYREAVRLAPEFAEAHFRLGDALRQQGRAAEAAMHLAEARRLGWRN